MRVLFLDIDGVVNCEGTTKMGVHFPIDPFRAFLVGRIQLETGCLVVLSSSWRKLPGAREEIEKRIVPIHDITGSCCSGIRGAEIQMWITRNVPYAERDEGGSFRYAILDDDSDMLLWQKDHFFQTTWYDGLTEEIAARVIEHLKA